MTFMLRAYAFNQKRLFFKELDNLKCCLTCFVHNGYNFEVRINPGIEQIIKINCNDWHDINQI